MMTVKEKTTIAAISELRNKSEQILHQLKSHRVVLERHKKPVAVMLNYRAYQDFEAMVDLAEDYILGALARERDRTATKKDFIDIDEW
jgi:PHD/YefM family antitoxin component YafN of YafNO toxin-antitoxin module